MLDQKTLKENLEYCPDTGNFTWLVSKNNRVKAGAIASNINYYGYVRIGINGKQYGAHRLAFLWMTGEFPDECDHINHQRSDNRWENLRSVTSAENNLTLCCAAGLVLGSAVAAPGRRPRRVALRENSLLALLLVAVSVPLFFLAALTESFVRESAIENTPRFALAGVYAVALVAAHVWLHRRSRRRPVDTSWLAETERPARQASA